MAERPKNWKGKSERSMCCWRRKDMYYSAWSTGRGQPRSPSLWFVPVKQLIWQTLTPCLMLERDKGDHGLSRGTHALQALRRFSSWCGEYQTAICIHRFLQFSIKKLVYKGSRRVQESSFSMSVFSPGIPITQASSRHLINDSKWDPIKMALSSWLGPDSLHLSRSLLLILSAFFF